MLGMLDVCSKWPPALSKLSVSASGHSCHLTKTVSLFCCNIWVGEGTITDHHGSLFTMYSVLESCDAGSCTILSSSVNSHNILWMMTSICICLCNPLFSLSCRTHTFSSFTSSLFHPLSMCFPPPCSQSELARTSCLDSYSEHLPVDLSAFMP